jgi:hypothetical protein
MSENVLAPAYRIAAGTVESNDVPNAIQRLHVAAINLTNVLHRFVSAHCARRVHKISLMEPIFRSAPPWRRTRRREGKMKNREKNINQTMEKSHLVTEMQL